MYVTRIFLNNIRGFRGFDLNVSDEQGKPRMRTAIIGKNGTCKTTLLRCIAIGLSDRAQANSLLAEAIGPLISENSDKGTITIKLKSARGKEEKKSISTHLRRENNRDIVYRQDYKPLGRPNTILVCGYGAGRSTEGIESGRPYQIVDSVYSLFSYDQPLIATELTLRRLEDYLGENTYTRTINGIKAAIGLSKDDRIRTVRGGGVEVTGPSIGRKIPLEGWADGYRRTFNWILDLYAWGMRAKKINNTGGIEGIILIDEPEQHTHPSMQIQLMSELSKLQPKLQIFAATHSPLVALGVEPEDLVALKRSGNRVTAESDLPEFSSYSAEDMLVDDKLFETQAHKPEQISQMESYRALVQMPKSKRSPADKKKLVSLARKLRNQAKPPVKESPLLRDLKELREKYDL